MKKILTIVLITCSLAVYAQKEKRVTPVYFMSGELTSADSFNRFVLVAVPEFRLQQFDSGNKLKWEYDYKDDKKKNLRITYYIETSTVISSSQVTKKRTLSHVEFRGDFDALARIYDRVFNDTLSAESLNAKLPIRGQVYYGYNDYVWNKNNYWFSFANFESDGYCMMFRKIK